MSLASGMLNAVKNATDNQLREIGETFLWFASQERDEVFFANIDHVMAKFRDPSADDLAAAIERGRVRVMALNDQLLADGLNHRRLLQEELVRRGDTRSADAYLAEVHGGTSDLKVLGISARLLAGSTNE